MSASGDQIVMWERFPVTRRVAGSVNVACPDREANHLLVIVARSLATDVGTAIGRRMTARQHRLLDSHLAFCAARAGTVVSLDAHHLIVEDDAAPLGLDRATLWQAVTEVGPVAREIALGESGIGLAAAALFVQHGARVHLVGIKEPELDVAVKELGRDRALGSIADVTDEAAVREAVRAGVAHYGGYDIVFSNAGTSGEIAAIEDYPSSVFTHTLQVHVVGAFHVLKHASPHIRDGGSVIITSSVIGLIGFAGLSGYVAAKHGQVGLMRAAAKELAPPPDPGQHTAPGPHLDRVPGRHRDACDGWRPRRCGGDLRRADPPRSPQHHGGGGSGRALPGFGRQCDGGRLDVRHRRRHERMT